MTTTTELRSHPSAKAYVMHGFIPEGENEDHIFGRCPFCGKSQKMYVNKKSKAWDCKGCSKSGGFITFLSKITELSEKHFKGAHAIKLAKSRGVKLATLRAFNIGFNPITGRFCFPTYELNGSRISDVRIYGNSRLMSTHGCKATLFNMPALALKNVNTIWICEGEWDGMALYEIMNSLDKKDIVVSVPGAGSFKADWITLFRGKKIRVLYDNDFPGRKGCNKVFNFLRGVAQELLFLHWDTKRKDGFDVRDLYKTKKFSPTNTSRYIEKHLKEEPPSIETDEDIRTNEPNQEAYDGDGLSAHEVYDAYKKHLHLPDTTVVDYLFGSILANRLPGLPIWSFIVAPSGLTKSEFIMSVSNAKNIHTEDNLTSAGLVSGFTAGGIDQSLLPQLDGKILCVKDFTTMMKGRQDQREAIFGMLRTIYDGVYKHKFGNIHREYRSQFGIIAGVTPYIEVFLENESSLGERFLRFALTIPNELQKEIEFVRRAMQNTSNETEIRDALQHVANECLNHDYTEAVFIPPDIEEKVIYLATFTEMLRGSIERDKFTKEILYKPFRGIGTRIAKQFTKLLHGICLFRRVKTATESEFEVIKKLAQGTIPSRFNELLSKTVSNSLDAAYTPASVAKMIRLSEPVCDMLLKSLMMLDVFEVSKIGLKTEFVYTESFIDILKKSEVYK